MLTVHNIAWNRLGVFWDGEEGSQIQALDDMSDEGFDEPFLRDDMAAAMIVANTTPLRWIVFTPQSDEPWEVCAWGSEHNASIAASEVGGFYFDGRTQAPEPHPDGIGYIGIKEV